MAAIVATRPRDAQKVVLTSRTFGRDGRGDFKKLQGRENEWRLRTGDWRIILTFENDEVWISQVDNRRDAH